jgi:hypothetical protein
MMIEVPQHLRASMVRQDFTAEFLNSVGNDPSVRPYIGNPDSGPVDVSNLLDTSVFLVTDHGGFVFHKLNPGYYCLHTMFLPEGRGKHVAAAARDAFMWMFCRTDAEEIVTYSPKARPGSRPPRSMGWRNWYEAREYDGYRLALMDWASNAPGLPAWGEWFHDTLEDAKAEQGSPVPAHEHDPANDRFAGMATAMCFYNQPHKGVYHYNRWAQVAGYELALVESTSPIRVNSMDAIWTIQNPNIEVMTCQQQQQ